MVPDPEPPPRGPSRITGRNIISSPACYGDDEKGRPGIDNRKKRAFHFGPLEFEYLAGIIGSRPKMLMHLYQRISPSDIYKYSIFQ